MAIRFRDKGDEQPKAKAPERRPARGEAEVENEAAPVEAVLPFAKPVKPEKKGRKPLR